MHLDKRLSIRCSHVFNSRHLCGRWGATRPVDERFAPTVAERRPGPWVQGSLRYNKRKPQVNHLRFLLLCGHALRRARDADRARLDRLARRRERGTQKGVPDHARGPRGRARRAAQTARADAKRRQADKRMELRGGSHNAETKILPLVDLVSAV